MRRNLPDDPATAYAVAVDSGELVAGPHVRAACARHLRDLDRDDLEWRVDLVERVLGFFQNVLRLNGGDFEGLPFVPLGWQAFILGSLFGWHKDGVRRFRVAYVETGKGSGKSPLAGGIGLYMLTADGEARSEVYAAATKKDQAQILFRDAVAMVEQSPALNSRLKKMGRNPVYNLVYHETGSFFKPISSDDSQSGPRPHCALLDEIHEHRSPIMVEMMRAGTKFRQEALIFMITNSGVDRTSICYNWHDYGGKVAAGELRDDSVFAFICAVDEDDDPIHDEDDPELGFPLCWLKANPSLGQTIQPKYLREQVREARGMPAKESIVRRLNFCQWVDAENPWISSDAWMKCEVDELPWQVQQSPCYVGLDLSGKRDLTALAQVWPVGDTYAAQVEFWSPGDDLVYRATKERVPFDAWHRDGHLHAPPGKSIDYAHVAQRVAEIYATSGIIALAFDPYRMEDFQRELDNLGIASWIYEGPDSSGDGIMLVRHGQGFGGGASDKTLWMPRSITMLEDSILDRSLQVLANPVLRWNAASAVLAQDAQDNRKWEKRKSTGRIDGVVALSMAVGAAALPEAAPQAVPSIFMIG